MSFRKGDYQIDCYDSDDMIYDSESVQDMEHIWTTILQWVNDANMGMNVAVWETIDGIEHEVITARFTKDQPYRVIHSCLDNGDRPGFSVWGFRTCEEA